MTNLPPDAQRLLEESYESDLTEEESEELLLMCGHGVGPEFSPATQVVLDALYMDELNGPQQLMARAHAAAALRAVAMEVVLNKYQYADWQMADIIMKEILAIADELESANG